VNYKMFWRNIVLLVFIFTSSSPLAAGESFLDLDEVENVQYSVSILDTPMSLTQLRNRVDVDENAVTMVNKFGQKYSCELPAQDIQNTEGARDEKNDIVDDIQTLLSPLYETSACLLRTKDWWTYEVCFGRKISQYHMENDKPTGAIINLGSYNSERKNENHKLSYHPEWYTNGSRCDLTGSGRETELKFVCNEQALQEFIGDIFEPKTCEYTIVIHTNKICSIQQFKPTTETVPLGISCKPVLGDEEMKKYEQYSQLKAKRTELSLLQIKAKQQKFLDMLTGNAPPDTDGKLSKELSSTPEASGQMDKLLAELGNFVDSALAGNADSSKVITFKDDLSGGAMERTDGGSDANRVSDETAAKAALNPSDMDNDERLVGKMRVTDQQPIKILEERGDTDPVMIQLKDKRNAVWLKIHENKNLLKKYKSQLHDTETFLQDNMEKEVKYDPGIIEKLEVQRRQLENAVDKVKETLGELENEERVIKTEINKYRYSLQKLSQGRQFMYILNELKKVMGSEVSNRRHLEDLLIQMTRLYKDVTGVELDSTWAFFDLADTFVIDFDVPMLRKYFKFADEEIVRITKENKANKDNKARKDDTIKEKVTGQIPSVLKATMEELGLRHEELDKKMDVMGDKFADLLDKLKGAEKDLDSSLRSLKRDGKKSVKKELRMEEEEKVEDANKVLKETKMKLMELESELDEVEEGVLETRKQLKSGSDKVAVELQQFTQNGLEDMDGSGSNKLAKEIELTIHKKLEKMGMKFNEKPIEIKVITTNIPMVGEDLDEMNGNHVEGMVHNLLYGNQQGYEDIDSQRKIESNYKFSWDDSLINKINKEIEDLEKQNNMKASEQSTDERSITPEVEEELVDPDLGDESWLNEPVNREDDEDVSLVHEMFGIGEQRTRPSSSLSRSDILFSEEEEEEVEENDQDNLFDVVESQETDWGDVDDEMDEYISRMDKHLQSIRDEIGDSMAGVVDSVDVKEAAPPTNKDTHSGDSSQKAEKDEL